MRLNETLVAAVIEGDIDAEKLAEELVGQIQVKDLTADQAAGLAEIKRKYECGG